MTNTKTDINTCRVQVPFIYLDNSFCELAIDSEVERMASQLEAAGETEALKVLEGLCFGDAKAVQYFGEIWVFHLLGRVEKRTGIDTDRFNVVDTTKASLSKYGDGAFCSIELPLETLRALVRAAEDRGLAEVVRKRMTPRSGWIPFYPANYAEWDDCDRWRAPQWELVFEAIDPDNSEECEGPDYSLYEEDSFKGWAADFIATVLYRQCGEKVTEDFYAALDRAEEAQNAA